MAYEDPDRHVVHEEPVVESGTNWTGYALVKYGFILAITIVILYFIAVYLLPMI